MRYHLIFLLFIKLKSVYTTIIDIISTMTKIQHSFFFEPREELYTGEETVLDLLLNRFTLSNDIQNHINGFIGEEPEHPYICGEELASYIVCHDDLNNEFVFPIEADEKHCFEQEIEGDFVVDDNIFYNSFL